MQQNICKRKIYCIIFTFLFCFSCFGTVTASAETFHSVGETVDNTVFVTFKKGTSESRGNYLGTIYYYPDTYYNEEFEYGVAIFPEPLMKKYDLYGDYLERKQSEGLPISLIIGTGTQVGNGYLSVYSMSHIPDAALEMRLVFVFFVRNTSGDVAYANPVISSFRETSVENPTNEELLSIAIQRQKEIGMEKSFGALTSNISKLVDSTWVYFVIALGSVAVIWGAYIGIRIAFAKKKEEQINAKGMIIRFFIGIVIMFVLAGGLPLLIRGMSAWAA